MTPDSNEGTEPSPDIKPPPSVPNLGSVSPPLGDSSLDNPLTRMPEEHQKVIQRLLMLQEKFEFPDEEDVKQATVSAHVSFRPLMAVCIEQLKLTG